MNTSKIKRTVKSAVIGVLVATIIITVLFVLISILVLCSNLSLKIISPLSVAVGGVGCFFAAFIISNLLRKKGLITGLIFGLAVGTIIFITTFLATGIIFSLMEFVKIATIVACSCLGGVFGVNSND